MTDGEPPRVNSPTSPAPAATIEELSWVLQAYGHHYTETPLTCGRHRQVTPLEQHSYPGVRMRTPPFIKPNQNRSTCIPTFATHTLQTSKTSCSLVTSLPRWKVVNVRDCFLQILLFAVTEKLKWSPQPLLFKNPPKTTA